MRVHHRRWALPGLVVFFGGLALALFIYRARPDREQNRLLSLKLIYEAIVDKLHWRSSLGVSDFRVVVALGLTSMFIVWLRRCWRSCDAAGKREV